jgi:hypothetical protein
MPGLRQAISMDLVSGAIFYLVLIMVVAFSVLNTFLMAILERTYEFGVMMAIGTQPGRLTRLVLAESAGMTLVGVTVGVLAGCLVTWYFMIHGIQLGGAAEISRQFGIPDTLYPRLTLISITAGPLAVLIITLLAALYPALRIRRLRWRPRGFVKANICGKSSLTEVRLLPRNLELFTNPSEMRFRKFPTSWTSESPGEISGATRAVQPLF